MKNDNKINLEIISLIPLKDEEKKSFECDYFSFRSSKDINSFIGNEFDFLDFYNNNLIKNLSESSSGKALDSLDDKEKYMVYIYPNHKSMLSMLEQESYIEIYENDKLSKKITIPSGGLLNILNKEDSNLEVKLIAKNIT